MIEKFSITIETLFTREKCFQSEKCFHSNRSSENCFQTHEKTREKNEVIPVRIEQRKFLRHLRSTRLLLEEIFNKDYCVAKSNMQKEDMHHSKLGF